MKKSFAVITPNLNMASFLEETIESVLLQKGKNDEYYIIDGGSTDDSIEIIQRYKKYLTGWISEPDNGYGDAVRKGFNLTKNEVMCWINSGDLLLPGSLIKAYEALEFQKADLIFGDDYYIDKDSIVITKSYGGTHSLKHMMLYGGWTPLQDACFWKRSLYETIGGIDPSLKYAADYDFFLRASWAGRCVYVPMVFSAFRCHSGQMSVARSTAYNEERQRVRRRTIEALQISRIKCRCMESFYWFGVRWRHVVTRHLRQLFFKTGITI